MHVISIIVNHTQRWTTKKYCIFIEKKDPLIPINYIYLNVSIRSIQKGSIIGLKLHRNAKTYLFRLLTLNQLYVKISWEAVLFSNESIFNFKKGNLSVCWCIFYLGIRRIHEVNDAKDRFKDMKRKFKLKNNNLF